MVTVCTYVHLTRYGPFDKLSFKSFGKVFIEDPVDPVQVCLLS